MLSDLEVDQQENMQGKICDFAYPLADGAGEVVVSTTRPETMLGDTAVAVHPDDDRYKHLHGKFVKHPFVDRLVPVILDGELVDPKFGTGVVKVTPAHDPNDFATGKRHGLEEINILNLDGTLNKNAGPFEGLERFKARKAVLARLEKEGLSRGEKDYTMTLPRSQRSGTIVEPIISTQWFVKMESLAKPAIGAVEDGTIEILPEDWRRRTSIGCATSKIGAFRGNFGGATRSPHGIAMIAKRSPSSRETPKECQACKSTSLRQDEDVLDTWFSSALWPFSTLGWPNDTADLKNSTRRKTWRRVTTFSSFGSPA